MKISVTILAKNSAQTIEKTLHSLRDFPDVLLYDTGSTDTTIAIAKKFNNVTVIESAFIGFGPSHNAASFAAKEDWILSIDSDEVLTAELSKEILDLELDSSAVYSLDRHNFFNGKWIKSCSGWYPDPVIRLYNKTKTAFTQDEVHERIKSEGFKIIELKNPLLHTPYRSLSDFLSKMQSYSDLFVKQNKGKKKSSFSKALLHALFAFIKSYLFKRGFLEGKEGFIISFYNAEITYYKYLKLSLA